MAFEDGLHIHLFENRSPVFHFAARDQLQPLGLRDRILAPMGFEITDHDVDAPLDQLVSIRQHLIGFSDAGGKSQVHFEPAAFVSCGVP